MTDSWEERMAAKTAARREVELDEYYARERAEYEAEVEQYIADYADTLTPETAAEEQKRYDENPFGCACVGGPLCCRVRYMARKRVLGEDCGNRPQARED